MLTVVTAVLVAALWYPGRCGKQEATGEAGKLVPWILSSKHGQRCAVIERQWIGGACPNIACLPSKALLHSAAVAHDARTHGHAPVTLQADMKAVRGRTAGLVARVDGFRGTFVDFGVELIPGNARFVGPRTIQIDGIDISRIPQQQLRRAIYSIPQDPLLIAGPIRLYMDPHAHFTDHQLLQALDKVGLMKIIIGLYEILFLLSSISCIW